MHTLRSTDCVLLFYRCVSGSWWTYLWTGRLSFVCLIPYYSGEFSSLHSLFKLAYCPIAPPTVHIWINAYYDVQSIIHYQVHTEFIRNIFSSLIKMFAGWLPRSFALPLQVHFLSLVGWSNTTPSTGYRESTRSTLMIVWWVLIKRVKKWWFHYVALVISE